LTKPAREARIAKDSGWLWFACAIALGAGYYIAFILLASAIETQTLRTGRIWGQRLAQARTLAERPALEREERALDDRLRTLDLHADKPTLAARFIRAASRIAAAHGVNLDGVDERATSPTPEPPPAPTLPPAGTFAFEPIPLDVSLSGSYGALLATMGELARAPVTMQIDVAALEPNAPVAGEATAAVPLTARLHIVLQRLIDDAPIASTPLSIPEDLTTHARPI
jgi:hypothetical protein